MNEKQYRKTKSVQTRSTLEERKCHQCGKSGHIKARCPNLRKENRSRFRSDHSKPVKEGIEDVVHRSEGLEETIKDMSDEISELKARLSAHKAPDPEPLSGPTYQPATLSSFTKEEISFSDGFGNPTPAPAGYDAELDSQEDDPGSFWWDEPQDVMKYWKVITAMTAPTVSVGSFLIDTPLLPYADHPVAAILSIIVLARSIGSLPKRHFARPIHKLSDPEKDRRPDFHSLTDGKHDALTYLWEEEVGPIAYYWLIHMRQRTLQALRAEDFFHYLWVLSHSQPLLWMLIEVLLLFLLLVMMPALFAYCAAIAVLRRSVRIRRVHVSNAIVRELSVYRNTTPYVDPSLVRERLDNVARSISTVKFDGHKIMSGDSIVEDSVQVSLHLYMDRRRRRDDFHIAL